MQEFAPILLSKLAGHLFHWSTAKGADFVVAALVESPATESEALRELLPHKDTLSKSTNGGAKAIYTKMTNEK